MLFGGKFGSYPIRDKTISVLVRYLGCKATAPAGWRSREERYLSSHSSPDGVGLVDVDDTSYLASRQSGLLTCTSLVFVYFARLVSNF